jgi:hypothetical protein
VCTKDEESKSLPGPGHRPGTVTAVSMERSRRGRRPGVGSLTGELDRRCIPTKVGGALAWLFITVQAASINPHRGVSVIFLFSLYHHSFSFAPQFCTRLGFELPRQPRRVRIVQGVVLGEVVRVQRPLILPDLRTGPRSPLRWYRSSESVSVVRSQS